MRDGAVEALEIIVWNSNFIPEAVGNLREC